MGGGVCWLDYNDDGWAGPVRRQLVRERGHSRGSRTAACRDRAVRERARTFRNVTAKAHADLAVQGDGCVAADLNGDGRPDLVVTTTTGVDVLWNNGDGTFTRADRAPAARTAGTPAPRSRT